MITRRDMLTGAIALCIPASALAHHGWQWTSTEDFTLSGTIRSVRFGNPHGILQLVAQDEALWTAELGQPWRHSEAGLRDDLLRVGAEITLEGHRSANPDELRMKAERVNIRGAVYDLYPNRS